MWMKRLEGKEIVEKNIVPNPSSTLWAVLADEGIRFTDREREAYALGKLSVLLEVETIVRSLHTVSDTLPDDRLVEQSLSAAQTIQDSLRASLVDDTHDTIIAWYEALLKHGAAASFVWPAPPHASSGAGPRSTVPRPEGTALPDQADTLILPEVPDPPT